MLGKAPFKGFLKTRGQAKGACMPVLKTARLVLRGFDKNDAVDVYAYAKSPVVGPMAGWSPHESVEESRFVVERFIEQGNVWAIVEKSTGRVIGAINLQADRKRDPDTQAKSIGYAIGESHWGNGYATEAAREVLRYAFEELGCPVVSAYHFPSNPKSRRVIKKLGFTYDGQLRMCTTLPGGGIEDDMCYSMTKEEYRAMLGKEEASCRR